MAVGVCATAASTRAPAARRAGETRRHNEVTEQMTDLSETASDTADGAGLPADYETSSTAAT